MLVGLGHLPSGVQEKTSLGRCLTSELAASWPRGCWRKVFAGGDLPVALCCKATCLWKGATCSWPLGTVDKLHTLQDPDEKNTGARKANLFLLQCSSIALYWGSFILCHLEKYWESSSYSWGQAMMGGFGAEKHGLMTGMGVMCMAVNI